MSDRIAVADSGREVERIKTLPPIEVINNTVPLSPKTGEPRRPALVVVAAVILYTSIAALAFAYGWHWFRAAYSETYPISAHLTRWAEPEPGKWVSLAFEFLYAGLVGIAAGAAGVVGFHAWNGYRWTRAWGIVAVALAGVVALLMNLFALIAVGLVVVGAALLWTPSITRYFSEWAEVRAKEQPRYRRPERIYYGRLPRFR